MERRLNKKINDYVHDFKTKLAEKRQSISSTDNQGEIIELTNYVYQYNNFELNKDDFMKRKRVKSTVPVYERCCAKRANGEQCTRRKKDNCQYCGTHIKGTPHGKIVNEETSTKITKIDAWVQEIKGIQYFIDADNNVYKHEDVMQEIHNPEIIAQYIKVGDNYSISSYKE